MRRTPQQVYRRGGRQGYYIDVRGFRHPHHSAMEWRRMQVLDLAGLRFRREPIVIKYHYLHRTRNYVPDLAVYDRWGTTLLRIEEIKPRVLEEDPQNLAKWAAARKWCQARGCAFLVVTERNILLP